MLGHLQLSGHLPNFESGFILDMLQAFFGYRHYDYRKCPTSLPLRGPPWDNFGPNRNLTSYFLAEDIMPRQVKTHNIFKINGGF